MTEHTGPSHAASPDRAVRQARSFDADAIGALQVRAWASVHAASLGSSAATLDPASFAAAWRSAIAAPPSRGHAVVVAEQEGAVIGFAAIAPPAAAGAPAEVVALEVDPAHVREGHGSRLLAAATDLLREGGAHAVRTWVVEDDGARAGFLRGAGLAPDGLFRHLDVAGRRVREDSWSAQL